MIPAFSYARVSSREQEHEGYSIAAQRRQNAEYAKTHGFRIEQEFIDVESAKNPGRKEFTNMLHLLAKKAAGNVVLVEKVDRLYRNRKDSLAVEELIEGHGVEVHFTKEGRVIGRESRSQDKFMHDIHVAVAKNYVENLREEVMKGMQEKAEQGLYPGRGPFGYRNNPATRAVDIDEKRAPVLRRAFEFYATGNYSLRTLRTALVEAYGLRITRSYLEAMLKNPLLYWALRVEGC